MLTVHPDPEVASNVELNILVDGLFRVLAYLLVVRSDPAACGGILH